MLDISKGYNDVIRNLSNTMEQLEAWQQETLKMKHLRFLVMRLLTDKKKDKKKLKKDKKIEQAEHIFSWRSSPVVTQQQVGYKE